MMIKKQHKSHVRNTHAVHIYIYGKRSTGTAAPNPAYDGGKDLGSSRHPPYVGTQRCGNP